MFENRATRKKFTRRGRTAAAAACVAAALITVGVGVQSAAAGTAAHPLGHPAGTRTPALAVPDLGSAALVQSEDFFQQNLSPVGATVDLAGSQGLSACTGEETMNVLTKGKAAAYADVTWTFDTSDSQLTESAADVSSDTSAASYEKQLNKLVRDCQDEPAGHWYYGAGHALTVPAGEGRWYPSFNGDGAVSGGVAVIRSGQRVGIVELVGQPSDDPGYVKGIAAAALGRLAG